MLCFISEAQLFKQIKFKFALVDHNTQNYVYWFLETLYFEIPKKSTKHEISMLPSAGVFKSNYRS